MTNIKDSWISRMMDIEYIGWFRIGLWGRCRLGFFTPLGGTCCFFRREALQKCGWWDPLNLTEDLEVSARMVFTGYKILMANVRSWEEAPVTIRRWVKQRSRWMRGYLQTFLKYWKLILANLRKLGLRTALTMLLGLATPFIMMLVPISYLLTILWVITDIFKVWMPNLMTSVFPPWSIIPLLFNLIFYGAALLGVLIESKRTSDIFWLTVCFLPYTILHICGVAYAFWQHLTKPIFWIKTEHYGFGARGFITLGCQKAHR